MRGMAVTFFVLMVTLLLPAVRSNQDLEQEQQLKTKLRNCRIFPNLKICAGHLKTKRKRSTSSRITNKTISCDCTCGIRSKEYLGNRQKRVIGGKIAEKHTHPWLARLTKILEIGDNSQYSKAFCGGTILNSKFILTAAHCLKNKLPEKIAVFLGDHDQFVWNEPDQVIAEVLQFHKHSDFNPKTYENDIALLEMKVPIEFNGHIQPACLPSYDKDPPAIEAWAVGWGKTSFFINEYPSIVREVKLSMISHDQCSERFPNEKITNNMLCAGGLGKNHCKGDSGGPLLICNQSKICAVHGIVSFAVHCGIQGHPGVYTKVYSYLNWMMKIMNSTNCITCL